MRRACLAAAAAIALLLPADAAAGGPLRVGYPFIGVNLGTLLERPGVDFDHEWDLMVGSGVQSARLAVYWASLQPYRSFSDVPKYDSTPYRDGDGVPTDFTGTDRMIGAAAQRRVRILPVISVAPGWAARHGWSQASPPRDPRDYARFVGALVKRYGPAGTFWDENPTLPKLPIRDWQVWNEPIYKVWWSDQPFAKDYVALLRATRKVVKKLDRHARIVLAGDPPAELTKQLEDVYKAHGRGLFDVVAVHPFTSRPEDTVTIVRMHRQLMDKRGDRRVPILVTEMTWPSSYGKASTRYGYEQTERGQAAKLPGGFRALARASRSLRIEAVFWYAWLTEDRDKHNPFDYSGLRKLRDGKPVSKPALKAFRDVALALEGCRSKVVADRCER